MGIGIGVDMGIWMGVVMGVGVGIGETDELFRIASDCTSYGRSGTTSVYRVTRSNKSETVDSAG